MMNRKGIGRGGGAEYSTGRTEDRLRDQTEVGGRLVAKNKKAEGQGPCSLNYRKDAVGQLPHGAGRRERDQKRGLQRDIDSKKRGGLRRRECSEANGDSWLRQCQKPSLAKK